jgi:CheY-like chemotaxis protein/HPt (histidine-containing phosphotransfer) domain-containing protein
MTSQALAQGVNICVDKPLRQSFVHDALVTTIGGIYESQHRGLITKPRRFTGRVLVAEDNAVNQRITIAQLTRLGLQADVASNGIEALQAIGQFPYDLVLMDCQMPDMDGYQATREIRVREQAKGTDHLHIVAMTANAMPGDRELCFVAGMDDYVAKPVRLELLIEVLSRYLPSHEEVESEDNHQDNEVLESQQSNSDENLIDSNVLERMRHEIGDDGIFVDVVNIFISENPAHISILETASAANDIEEIRRVAHKLKGSCHIIGAQRLGSYCMQLETLARKGSLVELSGIIEQMSLVSPETLQALEHAKNVVLQQAQTPDPPNV